MTTRRSVRKKKENPRYSGISQLSLWWVEGKEEVEEPPDPGEVPWLQQHQVRTEDTNNLEDVFIFLSVQVKIVETQLPSLQSRLLTQQLLLPSPASSPAPVCSCSCLLLITPAPSSTPSPSPAPPS